MMMGFSGAVQWWEEWQLRVLVLASLFLQFFLFTTKNPLIYDEFWVTFMKTVINRYDL